MKSKEESHSGLQEKVDIIYFSVQIPRHLGKLSLQSNYKCRQDMFVIKPEQLEKNIFQANMVNIPLFQSYMVEDLLNIQKSIMPLGECHSTRKQDQFFNCFMKFYQSNN